MLTLIVARARNGAIGRNGTIPWHAPEDLRAFQRETLGGALIMGRATWDSLPRKPLPQRLNIIVTSRPAAPVDGAIFTGLESALPLALEAGHTRIYAIGGAKIYAHFLPLAHRLLITEVDVDVPDADTFFPVPAPNDWVKIGETPLRSADPACSLSEYLRASLRMQR